MRRIFLGTTGDYLEVPNEWVVLNEEDAPMSSQAVCLSINAASRVDAPGVHLYLSDKKLSEMNETERQEIYDIATKRTPQLAQILKRQPSTDADDNKFVKDFLALVEESFGKESGSLGHLAEGVDYSDMYEWLEALTGIDKELAQKLLAYTKNQDDILVGLYPVCDKGKTATGATRSSEDPVIGGVEIIRAGKEDNSI